MYMSTSVNFAVCRSTSCLPPSNSTPDAESGKSRVINSMAGRPWLGPPSQGTQSVLDATS